MTTADNMALTGLRILYLTHRFPYPPHDGARIRAYHTIRHLAARNSVTVAAPLRVGDDDHCDIRDLPAEWSQIQTAWISRTGALVRMVAAAGSRRSASEAFFRAPNLARSLKRDLAAEAYDLVVVHCSAMAPYVLDSRVAKVMDFVDMDSQKWLEFARAKRWPVSLGYRLEGLKLRQLEARCARAFDACTTATPAELEILDGLKPSAVTGFFPNGVDLEHFAPDPDPSYDPGLIGFLGRMDYFPNEEAVIWFANQVLPRVRQRAPSARFQIIGAAPSARVRALQQLDGVEVTGRVEDVRAWVRNAALTVAPLAIARGTQNKILESMAMGVPVVTNGHTLKGVDARAGQDLVVAEDAEEMAEAVCDLLQDPDLRAALARAGRGRVRERHQWGSALTRFETFVARHVMTRPNLNRA